MSSSGIEPLGPKINRTELVHIEKWTCLKKLHWTDAKGRNRVWETAERTTRTKAGVDAVTMFCKLESKGHPTKTLVISQFRPPLNAYSIEFPAGLIDEGETAEDAARRELQEETGYTASHITWSYPLANDPGMSNTNQCLCVATVDLDAPENQDAKPRVDDEFIETHFVDTDRLLETIDESFSLLTLLLKYLTPKAFQQKGFIIDAGVYYFALALKMK